MAAYTPRSPRPKVDASRGSIHHGNERRRKQNDHSKGGQQDGKPPEPIWMSNILPLNLEENPASGRGRYSSVSVLEPVMRIERTGGLQAMGELTDESTAPCYRIVVTFMFEVAISGFDQGFQKHNRFFDSVSLRYLFRQGDEIDLRPVSDSALHGIQVTNTRDKTKAVDAGVSAGMVSVAAPNLSVQAQRDFKLTYQRSMNSWRMGQSFEPYPRLRERMSLPLASLLAARLLPSQSTKHGSKDRSIPRQDRQQHFFQVLSPHAPGCHCRPLFRDVCPLQHKQVPRHRRYNRVANWFWQTEASLRLWTPEIYSSFRCPITVMREVPVTTIESMRHLDDIRPYLHFDFEVDTQLRVLGFGFNFFKSAAKPAEMRAQSDTGTQLPPDHVQFCVTCCAENINWPRYPTRNLQAEAEEEALEPGPCPRRLQTNAEFDAWLKQVQSAKSNDQQSGPSQSGQCRPQSSDCDSDLPRSSHSGHESETSQFGARQVHVPSSLFSSLQAPEAPSMSRGRSFAHRVHDCFTTKSVKVSPICSQRSFISESGLPADPSQQDQQIGDCGCDSYATGPPRTSQEFGQFRLPPPILRRQSAVVLEPTDVHIWPESQPSQHPITVSRRRYGSVIVHNGEESGQRPIIRRRRSYELVVVREHRRRNSDSQGAQQRLGPRRRVRFQSSGGEKDNS